MKFNKALVFLSCITLLPGLLVAFSTIITQDVLIPLEICYEYNGNDFGEAPICNVLPAFSYFGFIMFMFGGGGFINFVGKVTLVVYFLHTYLHNRKTLESRWKYSKIMVVLGVSMLLLTVYAITQ